MLPCLCLWLEVQFAQNLPDGSIKKTKQRGFVVRGFSIVVRDHRDAILENFKLAQPIWTLGADVTACLGDGVTRSDGGVVFTENFHHPCDPAA